MLTIRKARVPDAEYISLLGRFTFRETFGHFFKDEKDLTTYLDYTFSVEKIRVSLKKENNIFWIALWHELPAGYAKLKKKSPLPGTSDEVVSQLQKIYVLKDFLDKKIGYALMKAVLSQAEKLSTGKLWLSVLKTNARAVKFYLASGFVQAGEHTFSIGKEDFDFTLMEKQ